MFCRHGVDVKMIGDGDLKAGQVDMAVDKIIAHACSTEGVVVVESFLQVTGP